jgi:CD109 antigen
MMKSKFLQIIGLLTVIATILTVIPSCTPVEAASSYVAIVPEVLHSGRTEAISFTLFEGDRLVKDTVTVTLLKDGKKITSASGSIDKKGTLELAIPPVDDGKYEIQVKGGAFSDKATIQVEKSFVVFVETDKPIYKPGQTIHIRLLTLDPELKPLSESITVDILDAKGIKIFRSIETTDEFGMANLDLPLSSEPNLGVWKINAATEKAENQIDVRVEEYVLPKYEVKVDLPKEWFLVSEKITGKISSTYSFGKPVSGELEIVATKYVGQWQEYARLTKTIDGEIEFEIPAAQYVAGTPAGGGQGNVQLDITVAEKSTGYVEKTSRLLTVAQSGVNLQLIPEGTVFKPGLPFNLLVITETPGNQPVDAKVSATITYMNEKFEDFKTEKKEFTTVKGTSLIELTPPAEAIALMIEANSENAYANKTIQSSYSPSGNFIHIEQLTEGTPNVGQKITFRVHSTNRAVNFYYEVISRGMVVFSNYTTSRDFAFNTTPLMAPTSKVLVYQILPNAEVAVDFLPFEVTPVYPHSMQAQFSQDQAEPAEDIELSIKTDGPAKVGIAVVDKSVFILAENRLNLQQVFDELERLYMEPQAEIHEISFYPTYTVPAAEDIFKDAGVVVMTNKKVPAAKEYETQTSGGIFSRIFQFFGLGGREVMEEKGGVFPPMMAGAPQAADSSATTGNGGLAEVERVRQFFPETWLWTELVTDGSGRAVKQVTVPDSITTWMLRAVAISKENGLGVAEDSLVVFQPFFLTIDLPYSAIRGEEFPVQVAIYNYLDTAQSVQVEIEKSDWFELLDTETQTIEIAPNDIGSAEFKIKPNRLGIKDVKITARSTKAADAAIKTIIIEPEGVSRELVENITLAGGITRTIDTSIPEVVVVDSGRAYITVTSSFLTQTIDGLDTLLQMPMGCGEQNMILFAPDVYITKYLQSSGQLKPEIMAKAEKLMITGYQRELTYRRTDGSFSAFGMSDESGSLWLTAFVLKCFAQAKGLLYIDDAVLNEAAGWITSHQNADGSFDSVGFVHHQEMLGGVTGKEALTAYTAIALMTAGEQDSSSKAIRYLEGKLSTMDDPYEVAITTYALELAQSPKKDEAYNKLMSLAKEDENGLHWGNPILPEPLAKDGPVGVMRYIPEPNRSAEIETTAYATLALVKHGDAFNASRAAKWLVGQRNAYGGYGSTQDTVVTLEALIEVATSARSDVDLTVTLKGNGVDKELKINKDNFDVLQIVEVPVNSQIEMAVNGSGDAIGQVVRRFNLPAVDTTTEPVLKIDVKYDTTEVEVNDEVKVSVSLTFNPPQTLNIAEAGMIVLDISIPTGFAPVTESITAITQKMENIKRYEIAGRKVIFYVENMKPGQQITFDFLVKALYPVKAKGVTSTAYSYYKPDIKGETLGQAVTVR